MIIFIGLGTRQHNVRLRNEQLQVLHNILYLLLFIIFDTRYLHLTYCQFIIYSYIITELLILIPWHALMLNFI
jgi:hypothetical protein